MNEQKMLAMLRCPATGGELRLAEKTLIERLNRAIGLGGLRDHQDQKITRPLDGGFVTSDQGRLYPIRDGIPTMVLDESIELRQLD